MKDPLRVRLLNHLENYLAQRELAINAAVAASAQLGLPKLVQPTATPVSIPATSLSYAPLTPPRASPDHLSPPANFTEGPLPRFSLAFPAPVISFASTANVPVFGAPTSSFKPVATPSGTTVANPVPVHITTIKTELSNERERSPTATTMTKAPFRPWADSATDKS